MNDMTIAASIDPRQQVQQLKAEAGELVKTLAVQHCAANARRFTWVVRVGGVAGQNSLGFQVDPAPYEGKVIWSEAPWTVLKVGRNEFLAVHESIIPERLELGSTVKVEEWARRHFDGTRLDAPKIQHHKDANGNAYSTKSFIIGDNRVPLPLPTPQSQYLQDLIKLIENGKMPDGVRTISQFLVDANAHDFAMIDPDAVGAENIIAMAPALQFSVRSSRFTGEVEINYDRALDYYRVRVGEEVIEDVDFQQLAGILAERIDDGQWMRAKVDVLKPAPRAKRAPKP